MSRYILRNNFQKLAETAGTVVNISTVKVELSEQAVSGTGVILYPRRKISFGSPIYAAKAAGESGAAVIGVIQGKGNSTGSGGNSGSTFYDGDDEVVTDEEIQHLFNSGNSTDHSSADTVNTGSNANEGNANEGKSVNVEVDDEYITDEELRSLFKKK